MGCFLFPYHGAYCHGKTCPFHQQENDNTGRPLINSQKLAEVGMYPLVIEHSHSIDGPFIDGLPY